MTDRVMIRSQIFQQHCHFPEIFSKLLFGFTKTSVTKHRIPSFIHPQFNKGIALVITLTLEAP
jgi:hypothetical protein